MPSFVFVIHIDFGYFLARPVLLKSMFLRGMTREGGKSLLPGTLLYPPHKPAPAKHEMIARSLTRRLGRLAPWQHRHDGTA